MMIIVTIILAFYTGSTAVCVNGAVRLVNGNRPSEGSVQICVKGAWEHVCQSYDWSGVTTKVVCRQLGYSTTCELLFHRDLQAKFNNYVNFSPI